jgi:hypothetical protein
MMRVAVQSGRFHVAVARAVLLAVVVVSLFAAAPVQALETLYDGRTIEREHSALIFYGGYPDSGLAFIAAPLRYFNVGFKAQITYDPMFAVGAPIKVQMLESENRTLNLALTLSPSIWFGFGGGETTVTAWFDPGVAAGWHFIDEMGWFWAARYVLIAPISEGAAFSHFPEIQTGFEIGTGTRVSVIVDGQVEFREYDPARFGFGGHLGLGVSLW